MPIPSLCCPVVRNRRKSVSAGTCPIHNHSRQHYRTGKYSYLSLAREVISTYEEDGAMQSHWIWSSGYEIT